MYKDIEKIYKKRSPYNIIKKWTLLIYFIVIFVSLILNFLTKIILIVLVLLTMPITIKLISEKVLNIKLKLNFGNKNGEQLLSTLIDNEEKRLFKNYLLNKNLYNEKAILCIIEHYRTLFKTKIINGNLISILSISISILLPFFSNKGFDFNSFKVALPYIVLFIVIIIIIYFFYIKIIEIKKFVKGEDGMIERLEEIFSEIYIECIDVSNSKKRINKNVKKETN